MEYIYILLLYLPSGFGRLTQRATGYQYTHAAVSLDDTYTHFYAFSRLRAKTPPISGYIEEKRIYYTLGEDVPIYTKIFRVPVTKEGYRNAIRYMEDVKNDPEIMYNLIHMLLIPVFGGHSLYKAFHCGEVGREGSGGGGNQTPPALLPLYAKAVFRTAGAVFLIRGNSG
mgnify:CR=1 FL=1